MKLSMTKPIAKKFSHKLRKRRIVQISIVVAATFVLLNLITWFFYFHKTYGDTVVGSKKIGTVSTGGLASKLEAMSLLPSQLELTAANKNTTVKITGLGITLDAPKTVEALARQKHFLPLVNLFTSHNVEVVLKVNAKTLAAKIAELSDFFAQAALDAKIILNDGVFSISKESNGSKLNSDLANSLIRNQLRSGRAKIKLVTQSVEPKIKAASLAESLQTLKSQQSVVISYKYGTQTIKPTPKDISLWYQVDGGTYVLSDKLIQDYINAAGNGLGIKIQNLSEAVAATKDTLQKTKALDFSLIKLATKTYAYCLAVKGIDNSFLPELRAKVKSVYGDSRGWSLGGQVTLVEASSSCSFTVWLSAAGQMPSFGSICDSAWSCRVGPNVVINFDRWRYASGAWNSAGGNLDDYRTMVINHETGHWFGFGHLDCGGAGQLAPVMLQQSIDLQGCKFNPWPTASELQTFRSWLKL